MGTAKVEERLVTGLDMEGGVAVSRMFQPEAAEKATMLEGDAAAVADRIVAIFKEAGAL
jgi:hypothetical protein